LQLDSTKVKVNVLSHNFGSAKDSITIDLTPAYELPALRSVTRTMVHTRDGEGAIDIIDEFDLEHPTEVIESLPTHGSWKSIDAHTLLFTQDGQRLKVVVDAPGPISLSETKVNDYGNAFTRVEIHIPVQGRESVTLHFTTQN
jgi:hypothetical protein